MRKSDSSDGGNVKQILDIRFGVDRIILSDGTASTVDTINIASCSPDERGLGNP